MNDSDFVESSWECFLGCLASQNWEKEEGRIALCTNGFTLLMLSKCIFKAFISAVKISHDLKSHVPQPYPTQHSSSK